MSDQGPRPLPFTVKPRASEHYTSYIRRLAQANHLRPSLLRAYVNTEALSAKGFQIDWLAALASRPADALQHALTGLPKPRPPDAGPPKYSYPKRKIPRTPADRLAHDLKLAQDQVRFEDERELYARIRADHAMIVGMSVDRLTEIYMLSRQTVREILAGKDPHPPGLSRHPRPRAAIGPVQDHIHRMWREGITLDQMWAELVDHHEGSMSKATLKIYIRQLRHSTISAV